MLSPLQRESLPARTAAGLARELGRGAWRDRLPTERQLCGQLQISRTTLRKALRLLRQQGLIATIPRQGTMARRPAARRRRAADDARAVGLLLGEMPETQSDQSRIFFAAIENHLFKKGYRCDLHILRRLHARNDSHDPRQLEELTASRQAACWAISAAPKAVQEWFMRRGTPALVLGSCYPGVNLPELDVDYAAVCRHAALTLLRLGHRRLVYLAPERRYAGDLLSEEGVALAARAGHAGARVEVIRHDGATAGICRVLERHFRQPAPATALIVSHARPAVTVASWLTDHGRRIPQNVSLICRDADPVLEAYVPAIAHYLVDNDSYARQCARILIRLAESGTHVSRVTRLMAHFVPGGAVAPPPPD